MNKNDRYEDSLDRHIYYLPNQQLMPFIVLLNP